VILRQNKAVHYEAPFLYLLFGSDRALLVDTGATPDPPLFPLRATVDRLLDGWLAAHPATATSCWCCTPMATATTSPATASSAAAPTPPWWARTMRP
jgi:hypothetical protein